MFLVHNGDYFLDKLCRCDATVITLNFVVPDFSQNLEISLGHAIGLQSTETINCPEIGFVLTTMYV